MFFSFEGIDGSGKSTQARLLADALRQRGWEVVEVREPGGTRLGERVRDLLLDPDFSPTPQAELLLFSSARAQLAAEVVRFALDRGAVVIADRFFDSSTAYQGGGRAVADPEWMNSLHRFATSGLVPTRTYLIDVSPETAASRRGRQPADRMEQSGDEFYRRVRAAYLALAEAESRIVVLDGERTVASLHDQISTDAERALRPV